MPIDDTIYFGFKDNIPKADIDAYYKKIPTIDGIISAEALFPGESDDELMRLGILKLDTNYSFDTVAKQFTSTYGKFLKYAETPAKRKLIRPKKKGDPDFND